MRWAILVLAMAGLMGNVAWAQTESKTAGGKEAHLGVAVAMVPPAVYSQLPGMLSKGQGALIVQVAKDSPAAKAGLEVNDILLSYGDQKISSPEQLVKLVRGDKAGHQIALSYLHGGKVMKAKATLGEAEPAFSTEPRTFRFVPDDNLRQVFEDSDAKTHPSFWESFDELKLTRQDDKHCARDHRLSHQRRQETAEDLQRHARGDPQANRNAERLAGQ